MAIIIFAVFVDQGETTKIILLKLPTVDVSVALTRGAILKCENFKTLHPLKMLPSKISHYTVGNKI